MKEKFKEFLDKYVKFNYDFDTYIEDLTSQWSNTGNLEYELSSAESITGKPELFSYTLEELQELGYGKESDYYEYRRL